MRKTTIYLFIFLAVGILATSPILALLPTYDLGLAKAGGLIPRTSENLSLRHTPSQEPTTNLNLLVPEFNSPPPPNGVTTLFDWWNTSWHYRIRLDIDALSTPRFNVTIPTYINMTAWLEDAGISEIVDDNSTRVVEQDPATGGVIVEQPSVFFKDANWDATSSATGWLLFFLDGYMAANTNRTVFVYFDTLAKDHKTPPTYPEVVDGWFSQYYGYNGGHFSMPNPAMYVWKNLDITTNQISYHDGSGVNFPPGSDHNSDWEHFSANYTAWLPVTQAGTYGFQTSSDDGSWFYVNGSLVVNNGGGHGTRTISASKYLTPGLYPLWVPWYENTGGAKIDVRWLPAGESSYDYLTGANVTVIKWGIQMDPANPCNLTWGTTIGIFLLRVHVANVDGKNLVNTPVHLLNASNPSEVFDTQFTDVNGNASFNVISVGDYILRANFTTPYPTDVTPKLNVTAEWQFNLNSSVEGELLERNLRIGATDITYSVFDLDARLMKQSPTETTRIFIYNASYGGYLAYGATNSAGQVTFTDLPVGQYTVSFDYTNSLYTNDYGEPDMPDNSTSIYATFTHRMILPLIDLPVTIISYDGLPVPNVRFSLDSQSYPSVPTHIYGPITNGAGQFTFGHIINGSWLITAYRNDDYGQNTENQTLVAYASTPGTPLLIDFPLDNLRIHVQETVSGEKLAGANVTIWKGSGTTLVTSATTDGNGDVIFVWLRNASYWVNATILGQYAVQGDQIGVDLHNIAPNYLNVITVRITVTFGKLDCAFFLENASIIYTYFNSNFTLRFQFVNVTGGLPDVPIDETIAQWIGFSLTHSQISTINGFWTPATHDLVWHDVGGFWYVWINTTDWSLIPSTEPYIVKINGLATNGTTAFNTPETLTISIIVQTTPTSLTNPGLQTEMYGDWFNFNITYTDTNHSLSLAGATLSYLITGDYTRSGNLVYDPAYGWYGFLHTSYSNDLNLPTGTYTLTITATLDNYETQIIVITLEITEIPTSATVTPSVILLNWSNGVQLAVNYSYSSTGTPILGATVYVMWAGTPWGLTYNGGTGFYERTLYGYDWSLGTFNNVVVVAQLANHTIRNLLIDVTIAETPTSATDPSDYLNQEWGPTILLPITYSDVNTSTNIPGAEVMLNLSVGYWSVVDNGDGTYDVLISMTFLPGTYPIELRITKNGYTQVLKTFTIELLIPLQIESTQPGGLVVYWTESFNIQVLVVNGFTTDNESGVTVTWAWSTFGGGFVWANNISTTSPALLASMFGTPGDYVVTITAMKAGASTAMGIVYVTVNANPTSLTSGTPSTINVYWAENGTLEVTWTDTFGSLGIDGADLVNASVYYGGTFLGLGTIIDNGDGTYTILLQTATLGMSANSIYTVLVTLTKNGYVQGGPRQFIVDCQPRITTFIFTEDRYSAPVGTPSLRVSIPYLDVVNPSNPQPITGATVTLTIRGIAGSFTMTYDPATQTYYIDLPISGLPANIYTLDVTASLANYEAGSTNIVLEITDIYFQIGPFRLYLNQLIFITVGIILVIVAFASFVSYKRATIPYQLKALNKAIKAINKNRPAEVHPNLMNRDAKMKESLRTYYRAAGIQYKEDAAG